MNDDLADLRRLLEALKPFLGQLVVIGGWAHRLYRFLDNIEVPNYEPIFTTDADIAVPSREVVPGDAILKQLRAHGFIEDFLSDDHPPVTHYLLGGEDSEFYAEFLTPLGPRRRQEAADTVVVGGVVAQTLPNLSILLIHPWSVRVINPGGADFSILVPNAVAYVAQKLVIMKDRRTQDRAKDILYVHDTLELFGARLDMLWRTWNETVRPEMGSAAEDVIVLARKYFAEVTDDIRRGVLIAGTRHLDPETLRLRCEIGLESIFRPDRELST